MKKRDFFMTIQKRKRLAGCVVLSASLFIGSMILSQSEPDFPVYTDNLTEITLEADNAPLAATPGTTVKTTVKKKVTKKVVKLKKKATKTMTKNLGTKTKKNTKTKKSGNTTITIETTVETNTKEAYKKKKKTKTVTKTVTTTTKTTTTVAASSSDTGGSGSNTGTNPGTTTPTGGNTSGTNTGSGSGTGSTSDDNTSGSGAGTGTGSGTSSGSGNTSGNTGGNSSSGSSSSGSTASGPRTLSDAELRQVANQMPANVLDAFINLGFKVIIDPSVGYSGYFNARSQSLTLKELDSIGTIYHELGHFIAFVAGNVDKSSSFSGIYSAERGGFPGTYKAYASQNASEYFAECMREHILRPSGLASACPNTANTLSNSISKITDAQVSYLKRIYGSYWK